MAISALRTCNAQLETALPGASNLSTQPLGHAMHVVPGPSSRDLYEIDKSESPGGEEFTVTVTDVLTRKKVKRKEGKSRASRRGHDARLRPARRCLFNGSPHGGARPRAVVRTPML